MADIKKMKMQLAGAVLSVMISAVALISATYAWYVSNTTVEGTTSTISAKANNFVLQIGLLENGAQHGDNSQSLQAETLGGKITPSSTQNIKDWYAHIWFRQELTAKEGMKEQMVSIMLSCVANMYYIQLLRREPVMCI